jgi:uncharacterized protein (TIGR02246 family)
MPSEESRRQILEIIHQLNDAWATGHPERLAGFFREDIVIVHPDFTGRIEGRDACIASYAEFCSEATIHGVKIGEPGIEVFGDTAVSTYSYEVDYEMGGERFNDSGRDLFVFVLEDDRWQAVWRTMIISQAAKVN